VVIAGLGAVDASGHLGFGLLIVFVALHGLGSGRFQPAFGGILPLLVEEPSLGSVALGQIAPERRRGALIYSLFGVNCILGVLMGLSPWFSAAAALQVGRGFCVGFAITLWDMMVMQRVPQHMLSRVISMDWFGSIGLLPAGLGIWPALPGLAAPRTLIAASSAFSAVLFLLGLTDRRIRSAD